MQEIDRWMEQTDTWLREERNSQLYPLVLSLKNVMRTFAISYPQGSFDDLSSNLSRFLADDLETKFPEAASDAEGLDALLSDLFPHTTF
jgi:hypothetical protein